MDSTPEIVRKRWIGIALFMLIALSFSYFFRINPPAWYEDASLPTLVAPFKRLIGAFGIFLGALVAERIFGTTRRITLVGTSRSRSWLMILFPVLLFTIIGVSTDTGVEPHLFGLVIGLQAALWVVLEEYGWRGYLQNELGYLRPWPRYLIIGVLWYVWHLWFLQLDLAGNPLNFLANVAVGFSIILGSSWGLGVVAEGTRSILVSACFHMLGSLLQFNPIITENVEKEIRWAIFGVCLVFWVIMLIRWLREEKAKEKVAIQPE